MDDTSDDKSRYKLRQTTLQYDSSKAVAREIEIFRGQGYRNNLYPDNSINTNLNSYFFLIPFILFSQFKRLGYIWYLIVTIFQYIPYDLSPLQSESTTTIFAISLFLNLVHDIFANYLKRKSDSCVNSRDSLVWSESSKQFIHKKWEDIRVGYVIVVKNNEEVPADLILIATSDSEDSCFFETFNLDGSTRLSMRKPVSDFAKIFESKNYEKAIHRIFKLDNAILKIDHPNDNYHTVYGSIKLVKYPKAIPLSIENFVLRGSKLKNTEWIMGIVVYTGPDTKIMINSQELWHKSKNTDKVMDKYIFWIFILLSAMTLILCILTITHSYYYEHEYKYFTGLNPSSSWMDILSFLILFSYLIPINYYSIVDLIGLIQFWFMRQDLCFYDDKKHETIISSSLRLNEDLGKVKYIFTDKTGTLTENKMKLKYFVIKGKSYDIEEMPLLFSSKLYDTMLDLLKVLAICHTVSPLSINEDIKYKGESLDEEALIMAAFMSGVEYKSTKENVMELKIFGSTKYYKIYGLNKFDPERKIMSIVVKELNCDKYPVLLCKGADDVLCTKSLNSEKYIKKLTKEIENHTKNGLRVLAIARKTLTEEEAAKFEEQWIAAKNAMTNSESRLKEVANLYEKDLYIIGAVAIEDKLQDGVSETVSSLRKAGIKIWMMTGDRRETSISTAYASTLFDSETEIIQLSYSHEKFLFEVLEKEYNNRFLPQESGSFIQKSESMSLKESESKTSIELEQDCIFIKRNESYNYGIAVEGLSLDAIMRNVKHLQYFLALGCAAKAVILYRTTPAQKARIVKIFNENVLSRPVMLAIGDGANDCAMINEANIGIGILGKEGCQAAKCSDFAIANFKCLIPLLQVYGHWNCIRMPKIRQVLIYISCLLAFLLFYYSFINMYSASFLYESWMITIFYGMLIILPIIWLGVIDKDYEKEKLIKKPELYYRWDFMSKESLWYIVLGAFQALLIFLLAVLFTADSFDLHGNAEDYFTIGCICFLIILQVVLYELWVIAKSWSLLFFIASIFVILFAFSFVFLLDYGPANNYYMKGTSSKLFSNVVNLINLFTVPLICLAFRLSFHYLAHLKQSQNYLRNKKIFKSTALISPDNVQEDFKQLFDFTNYDTAWDKKAVILNYKMKPITMRFSNPYLENEFQADSVKESKSSRRLYVLLSLIVFFIIFILNIFLTNNDDEHIILRALEIITLILIFFIFICLWFQQFEKYHAQLIISWIGLSLLFKIFIDYGIGYDMTLSSALMSFYTFIVTKNYSYYISLLNIANFIIYAAWMFTIEIKISPLVIGILNGFVYLFLGSGMVFLNAMISYAYERDTKLQYLFIETVKFQYNKGIEILSNLFPHFIKDKVKKGERAIVLGQPDVTVMFCDIYQFDSICATHSPSELIDLLDAYFDLLDKLCDDFGVAKIETVNKTFMTCAGIAQDEVLRPKTKLTKNHGMRTVELALAILDKLQHVFLKTGEKLRVKIGINSGPVIAGVVGLHKPQFSLVGDTVNTASRMMSTLKEPDSIQISKSTYELVKDCAFDFIYNKVEAKGKGILKTFLVQKQPLLSPLRDRIDSHNNGSTTDQDNSWIVKREATKTEGFIRRSNRFYSVKGGEKCKKIINMTSILNEMIERSGLSKQELGFVEGIKLTRFHYKTEEEVELRLRVIDKLELAMKYKIWGEMILILLATTVHLFRFIFIDKDEIIFGLISLKIVILLSLIGVLAKYRKLHIKIFFSWILFAGFLSLGILNVVTFYNSPKNCCILITLEILFELQLIGTACFLPFANLLFSTLLLTIPTILIISINFEKEEALETIFPFIFYCLLNMLALHNKEKQSRITFNLHKLMKSEISKTKRLLNQLIPPHAVRNMMNDLATTDRFNEVTMIFADICGFTDFSSSRSPEEVISMLSGFFTIFDNLCLSHNVFKVHTIGDCYVIMSFRDAQSRKTERNLYEECENMLNMAFDMVKAIKDINEKNMTKLNMRIGMHTGDLVGGITGNDIVRYDIYGPDVDVANKMESNGMPGKVNVSEVTKKLLEEGFPGKYGFEFNKTIIHKPINRAFESYYASYNNSL
ncbi:unnamed protein product [Blepharisma stoltei]|uniref:P-type phospholipid transporter n=1 Tax=Blepharisma stoltei TaxID=1481888 RepID=A0AAU9IDT4_9CILI|nr:unnamed protein product [Blepharisma stoltei]